ncbi:Mrp complex subunit C1 [Rickettsiales bacterium Ac37b]|nr:Mrp complex subunit C1 [Rickettsiales bacterium Ac37b]
MFYYYIVIILFVFGICGIVINSNLIKKIMALGIIQTSILLFFLTIGKVKEGQIPVLKCLNYDICPETYVNPLPQVLMLTAIVVGLATLSVALALIIRIKETYQTIEEEDLPL